MGLLWGFNSKFPTSIPTTPFICGVSPRGPDGKVRFILGELFDTWIWQPNDQKWFWLDGIESCCVGVEGSSKSICVRRFSPSALSLFRFHLSPFPPETPYTQASGNLTEARGIEHYGLSGLNKSFFVCFFLAPEICGFDLPGFICSCRVSTSAFHSTYIQTRSTIPNHILSINIFNNEYRTIWGLNLRTWMFHVDSVSRRMVP